MTIFTDEKAHIGGMPEFFIKYNIPKILFLPSKKRHIHLGPLRTLSNDLETNTYHIKLYTKKKSSMYSQHLN